MIRRRRYLECNVNISDALDDEHISTQDDFDPPHTCDGECGLIST